METRSPITLRALLAVFAVVLLIVGVNAVSPIGAIDPRVPVIHCHGVTEQPQPGGDNIRTVYGDRIKCAGGGAGAVAISWPDGQRTQLQHTRTPEFTGVGHIELLDDDGETLASLSVRIEPDVTLECEGRDGDVKTIFQLEATDLRSTGWDYVFTNLATGETVRPGEPKHPNGGSEEGLERVVLGEAESTGLCRVTSKAAEAFGGDYQLTLESPWEPTQTTSLRMIGPSSKTKWAGTQPGEVTATVTVNNVSASERTGVYVSGCT